MITRPDIAIQHVTRLRVRVLDMIIEAAEKQDPKAFSLHHTYLELFILADYYRSLLPVSTLP